MALSHTESRLSVVGKQSVPGNYASYSEALVVDCGLFLYPNQLTTLV